MTDTVAGKQRDENVYFTMLPNIVLDMLADGRISRYDFTLYMVLLRTAGRSGHCRKSSRTLQQECDIGAGLLTQSKANLVEAGLINIEEVKRKNKRPFHRITIVDVWPENMRHFEGKYRNGGDSTPDPAPTDDDCSEPEQSCSEPEQACSETESKKNTTNKNKNKKIAADAAPAPDNGPSPPVQPHIALIDAMADELDLNAVDYGRHARDAVALLEMGATPDKIRQTVRFALSDPKQREFFKTQPFSMTTCRKYFELAMAAGNSNGRSSGAVMDF